ncbi:uncharacterized protein LOC134817197 [Bolinopsis microptera]|uniref:uncharacterized protein LOC134817197 n=1 Tax=Bolinopsis microptera TaxID=2820187 RepID=UPI003078D184
MTDFFLSHDWGTDEVGRNNHDRVGKVNDKLKEMEFETWFDQDKLSGNIMDQMAKGIETSKVVLVFLTRNYVSKVTGDNASDNCKLEFNHAARVLTSANLLPVVMESSMTNTSDWKGSIGIQLGNKLYVNMTGNVNDPVYLEEKIQELLDIVKTYPNMGGASKKLQEATAADDQAEEELDKEQKTNEIKAKRAKSSRGQIKYTVTFTNKHDEEVDLIWKNYKGEEVQVRQGISPGQSHSECSYLTHPFIARDIITERVCYFQRGSVKKVVFEGMDFGAPHDGRIDVDIL